MAYSEVTMSTIRFRPLSAEWALSRETLVQTGRDLSVPVAGKQHRWEALIRLITYGKSVTPAVKSHESGSRTIEALPRRDWGSGIRRLNPKSCTLA